MVKRHQPMLIENFPSFPTISLNPIIVNIVWISTFNYLYNNINNNNNKYTTASTDPVQENCYSSYQLPARRSACVDSSVEHLRSYTESLIHREELLHRTADVVDPCVDEELVLL